MTVAKPHAVRRSASPDFIAHVTSHRCSYPLQPLFCATREQPARYAHPTENSAVCVPSHCREVAVGLWGLSGVKRVASGRIERLWVREEGSDYEARVAGREQRSSVSVSSRCTSLRTRSAFASPPRIYAAVSRGSARACAGFLGLCLPALIVAFSLLSTLRQGSAQACVQAC
jgi:hypothetical protein